MGREIVDLKNIYFSYNGDPVLEDINLKIMENDFMAIIGPNGGGKTTLIKIILGLIKPLKGYIRIMGEAPEKGRRLIGYLQQHPGLDMRFPISVYDVVLMGRYGGMAHGYTPGDREAVQKALITMGISKLSSRHIGMLSGGQLQRVLIARAIVREPLLLLMDEPLASIDPEMQRSIYELFAKLRKKMAIVFVTHDIGAISIYIEKVACLNRRLFYHGLKEGSLGKLEKAYGCPVEAIAHGVPHRVLKKHFEDPGGQSGNSKMHNRDK